MNSLSRLFLCLSLILVPASAFAHDNVRIGVVSIIAIEAKSTAWNKKVAGLEERFNQNRAALVQDETAVKKKIEAYEKRRALLSAEQQQEGDAEINQQLARLQQKATKMNTAIEKDSADSNIQLRQKIADIIGVLARERSLDLILEVGDENFGVVYFTERIDLTAEVIRRLNEQLPRLD